MADLISLKEFRKQTETAILDEHVETLERSINRLRAAEPAAIARSVATVPEAAEAPSVSVSTLAAQEFEGM